MTINNIEEVIEDLKQSTKSFNKVEFYNQCIFNKLKVLSDQYFLKIDNLIKDIEFYIKNKDLSGQIRSIKKLSKVVNGSFDKILTLISR